MARKGRTKTELVTKPPVVVKKATKKPVVKARKEGRKGMAEYRQTDEGKLEKKDEDEDKESPPPIVTTQKREQPRPRTEPPTPLVPSVGAPLSIEDVLKWMEEESYRQHGEVDASCCRRLVQLARVRVQVIAEQKTPEARQLLATTPTEPASPQAEDTASPTTGDK